MFNSCQIGISVYKQPLDWLKVSVESALSQSQSSNSFCTVRLDGPDACSPEAQNWLFWNFRNESRLQVLVGSRRLGTFGSYREIFQASDSIYLCQLDADDWLEDNIISRCTQELDNDINAPFAYTKYRLVNEHGDIIGLGKRSREDFNNLEQMVQFNTFHLRVLKRSAYDYVGGYNPELKYSGDYDISLKLAEIGKPVFINAIGYSYRKYNLSTSSLYMKDVEKESFGVACHALNRRKQNHLYELSREEKIGKSKVVLKSRRGPVLIAGMHRSGTSVVAKMFKEAGIDLGADLLRADNNNLHGYFEEINALNLNRMLLNSFNVHPDWGCKLEALKPSSFDLGNDSLIDPINYLKFRYQANQFWGWKDPRNSLLLDYWDKVEPGIRVVAVFRPPWDVVSSLSRIYRIFREDEKFAVKTWILFNQKLLEYKKNNNHKFLLANSCHVLDNPKALVALAEQKLGLFGLANVVNDEELRSIVQPDLYRKITLNDDLANYWSKTYPAALSTFNALKECSDL